MHNAAFPARAVLLLTALLSLARGGFARASAAPDHALDAAPRYTAEIHFKFDLPPSNGANGGNAVLLVNEAGPSVFFDVGDVKFGKTIPDRLEALGISRVVVVLSHCHTDHAGGILSLLVDRPDLVSVILYARGENFPGCLLVPLIRDGLPVEQYQQALTTYADKFRPLAGGRSRLARNSLGAMVRVFQPVYDASRVPGVSWNDRSLTLCVTWPNGAHSLLFGDTSAAAMGSLLRKEAFGDCLRSADILLANHHANAAENTNDILNRMATVRERQPLWLVVISAQSPNGRTRAVANSMKTILQVSTIMWTQKGSLRIACGDAAAVCTIQQPITNGAAGFAGGSRTWD